jgi:hypothetical protein
MAMETILACDLYIPSTSDFPSLIAKRWEVDSDYLVARIDEMDDYRFSTILTRNKDLVEYLLLGTDEIQLIKPPDADEKNPRVMLAIDVYDFIYSPDLEKDPFYVVNKLDSLLKIAPGT